jgi:sugar phosphate isomerase/epimerase
MQLVMFSKHLAPLPIDGAADVIHELGFDGVDLTVRPAGHVLPEDVTAGLPAAVETFRSRGLAVPMITTGVTSADNAAEAIFRAAAGCEIRSLKLGYWTYRPFGTLMGQIDAARRDLDGIERLAAATGVCACVHTHSGDFLSATDAGLYLLLRDRDPQFVAAYLDPGHMTVEGGLGGWQQGIDLLQDRIRLVAVKDFGWVRTDAGGSASWRPLMVPLEEGIVRWPEVFARLHQVGFDGVVSLHSEYQGSHSWRDLSLEELIDQTRADLHYLRPVIDKAGFR